MQDAESRKTLKKPQFGRLDSSNSHLLHDVVAERLHTEEESCSHTQSSQQPPFLPDLVDYVDKAEV